MFTKISAINILRQHYLFSNPSFQKIILEPTLHLVEENPFSVHLLPRYVPILGNMIYLE